MSSDLISRSALLEDFRNTISEKSNTFAWLNMISRQPAYDVDKIVEKLANCEQRLKHYEDLEEQGLLLKLPCKVGDTVHYISEGFIEPCTVEVIFLADYVDKDGNQSYMAEIHYDREDCPYVSTEIYFTDIGKTVFLTQAEAEKTLKKMNETEDKK